MKTKGWLVEEATHMPARPIAWFRAEYEGEARSCAARVGGVVREMDGAVQPNPHAPAAVEASR